MSQFDCSNPYHSISNFVNCQDYFFDKESFIQDVETFFQKEAYQDKKIKLNSEFNYNDLRTLKMIAKQLQLENRQFRLRQLFANIAKVADLSSTFFENSIYQLKGNDDCWGWIPGKYVKGSILNKTNNNEIYIDAKPSTLFFLQQYFSWCKEKGTSLPLPYSGIIELKNFAEKYNINKLKNELEEIITKSERDESISFAEESPHSGNSDFFDPQNLDVSMNRFVGRCCALSLDEQRRFFSSIQRFFAKQFELHKERLSSEPNHLLGRAVTDKTVPFFVTALPQKDIFKQQLLASIQWVADRFFKIPDRNTLQLIENHYNSKIQYTWVESASPSTENLRMKINSSSALPFGDLMSKEGKISGSPESEVELLLLANDHQWANVACLIDKISVGMSTNPQVQSRYLPLLIKHLKHETVQKTCQAINTEVLCQNINGLNEDESYYLLKFLMNRNKSLKTITKLIPQSLVMAKALERYITNNPQQKASFSSYFQETVKLALGQKNLPVSLENSTKISGLSLSQAIDLYYFLEKPETCTWMNLAQLDKVRKGLLEGLFLEYPNIGVYSIAGEFIQTFFPKYLTNSSFTKLTHIFFEQTLSETGSSILEPSNSISQSWIIEIDTVCQSHEFNNWLQTNFSKTTYEKLSGILKQNSNSEFIRQAQPTLKSFKAFSEEETKNFEKEIQFLLDLLTNLHKDQSFHQEENFKKHLCKEIQKNEALNYAWILEIAQQPYMATTFSNLNCPKGASWLIECLQKFKLSQDFLIKFPIQNIDNRPSIDFVKEYKDKLFKQLLEFCLTNQSVPTSKEYDTIIEASGFSQIALYSDSYWVPGQKIVHSTSLRNALFDFFLIVKNEDVTNWISSNCNRETIPLLIDTFSSIFDNYTGSQTFERWIEIDSLIDEILKINKNLKKEKLNILIDVLRKEKSYTDILNIDIYAMACVKIALENTRLNSWLEKQTILKLDLETIKRHFSQHDIPSPDVAEEIKTFCDTLTSKYFGSTDYQSSRTETINLLKAVLPIIGCYTPSEREVLKADIHKKIIQKKANQFLEEKDNPNIKIVLEAIKADEDLLKLLKHENLTDALNFIEENLAETPGCVIS